MTADRNAALHARVCGLVRKVADWHAMNLERLTVLETAAGVQYFTSSTRTV